MALVVVQRGHVPRTSGAVGAPGEQAFARAAAERVRHHVRRTGHQVRIIDADPPASAYRGDLFVSLHYDSSSSSSAHGASVGHQTGEGRRFAAAWKRYYTRAGWNRGFRPDNYTANLAQYYGVRTAVQQGNRAAFIAEAGFHSNPGDAALLRAPDGPDRVGWAVAAAVAELTGRPIPPREGDDMSWTHKIEAKDPDDGRGPVETTTGAWLTRGMWRVEWLRNRFAPDVTTALDAIRGDAVNTQLRITELEVKLDAVTGQLDAANTKLDELLARTEPPEPDQP